MRKLGFVLLLGLAALAAHSRPAAADLPIYYCELTGAGYQIPNQDSYQVCLSNCYVLDSQNQATYGECWLTPPPPPPPPGTPEQPPGGPETTT